MVLPGDRGNGDRAQAVISGAFSVTRQPSGWDSPRITIATRRRQEIGPVMYRGQLAGLCRPSSAVIGLRFSAHWRRLARRGHRNAGDRHAAFLLRVRKPVRKRCGVILGRRDTNRRPSRSSPETYDQDLTRRLVPLLNALRCTSCSRPGSAGGEVGNPQRGEVGGAACASSDRAGRESIPPARRHRVFLN